LLKITWDDLRVQLHAIIIPERLSIEAIDEQEETIKKLNANTPDFLN